MRIHRTTWSAACFILGSCSAERVAPPPPAPVNWQSLQVHPVADAGTDVVSAKERALPDAYAASLASPDFAQLGPLLDDDARFASPGMDDAHGRTQVVQAHAALFGAFDNRSVALTRVWRTPSEQTVEWTLTGVQARDWLGLAATHKSVAFKGLTLLWTKNDGGVVEVHVYVNTAVVKAQLGSGPKELLALLPAARPEGSPQIFEQGEAGAYAEKTNVDVVRSALDALEKIDEPSYVQAMTPDVEMYTLDRAEPARGKEGAIGYFRAMHKAIGQFDTTVTNAWGVRPFAIVEYTISGEQLGPLSWIPAQRNKVIRLNLVDVCEIREGKIARIWRYDNPAQIATATTGP
jgi:ketosteroid isomerase-like protein